MRSSVLSLMLIGFAATPALAQTTTPSQPPAVTTPSAPSGATVERWYTLQPDDMRASKIIGSSVRDSANESIGEVNEIVLDRSGRVEAIVIGVGGFLGMGERQVAVHYTQLQPKLDSSGKLVIMTSLTSDELKNAPAFTWTNK